MQDSVGDFVNDAELSLFERRTMSLEAASAAGLPGQFASFSQSGLRVTRATDGDFGFLNTVEGVTEESIEFLPEVLARFASPRDITVVATTPSQALVAQLRGRGFTPTPNRPVAFLRPGAVDPDEAPDHPSGLTPGADRWRIHEVSTAHDHALFLDLLDSGYGAVQAVSALIRAEHAVPEIRPFIASRDGRAQAAAAMSLHGTVAVLGGAASLPTARGTGAQTALLAHRLRVAHALGASLVAASAAAGSPSLRNLARLGFTIVNRTAWVRAAAPIIG
ncbi:MAG: hypothetical protein H7146_11990 [Burkholderiaceae bacterium]|nr:hypothetical protein [Microbacteriaceae bacterium]